MDIGKPKRRIVIEPIAEPVRRPEPAPVREREKEPART